MWYCRYERDSGLSDFEEEWEEISNIEISIGGNIYKSLVFFLFSFILSILLDINFSF